MHFPGSRLLLDIIPVLEDKCELYAACFAYLTAKF